MGNNRVDALLDKILAGGTADELSTLKSWASLEIRNEIARLEKTHSMLDSYLKFATLPGETYELPSNVADWLALSLISHDVTSPERAVRLRFVGVSEYEGRTVAVTSDGYRIHAHTVDLPIGIYSMIRNKLRLAPLQDFIDWPAVVPTDVIEHVYEEPFPSTERNSILAMRWKIDGRILRTAKSETDGNYLLSRIFWQDALSISPDKPKFFAVEKMTTPSKALLCWPDAFACIMPMNPAK